jgi:hypothetical protein
VNCKVFVCVAYFLLLRFVCTRVTLCVQCMYCTVCEPSQHMKLLILHFPFPPCCFLYLKSKYLSKALLIKHLLSVFVACGENIVPQPCKILYFCYVIVKVLGIRRKDWISTKNAPNLRIFLSFCKIGVCYDTVLHSSDEP